MSRAMADTPKRRARRQFTDEFKASAVRLVLDGGKTVGGAARDLDATETALREWVKRARADRTHGRTGLTTAERESWSGCARKCASSRRSARSYAAAVSDLRRQPIAVRRLSALAGRLPGDLSRGIMNARPGRSPPHRGRYRPWSPLSRP